MLLRILVLIVVRESVGFAQGPIAHFSFDTPGSPGDDVAGSHDAISVVGVSQVAGGVVGQAGQFGNGYLQLPASSDLRLLGGDFTLSIFVKGTPPSTANRN